MKEGNLRRLHTVGHSGKGKTIQRVKQSVVVGWGGKKNEQAECRGF